MLNNKVPQRRKRGSRVRRGEPQQASATMSSQNKSLRTPLERSTGTSSIASPFSSKRIASAGRVDSQKQSSPRIEVPRVNSIATRSYKAASISNKNDIKHLEEKTGQKKTTRKVTSDKPGTSPSSPRIIAAIEKKIKPRSSSAHSSSGSKTNINIQSELNSPVFSSSPLLLPLEAEQVLVENQVETPQIDLIITNNNELIEPTTTITGHIPTTPYESPSFSEQEQKSSSEQQEDANVDGSQQKGFDLKDHFSLDDLNDFDNDTDEEEYIYGNHSYEKHLRTENILKVSSSITFAPYVRQFERNTKRTPYPEPFPGCFEAKIKIHNSSKFNMTYAVKGSSLHMFRYYHQIGYIYPSSSVEVRIITNPKYRYTFEDISDAFFVVQGHPLLFRNQLLKEKVDAFWRAVDSDIIPMDTIEIHPIKYVYQKHDTMLDHLSMIDRIPFSSRMFFGNDPIIKYLDLPSIDLLSFNQIWNGDEYSKLLAMKFKIRQLRRLVYRNELEMKDKKASLTKAVACVSSCIMCYLMLFVCMYPVPPTPVELSWYETASNSVMSCWDYVNESISNLFNAIWD